MCVDVFTIRCEGIVCTVVLDRGWIWEVCGDADLEVDITFEKVCIAESLVQRGADQPACEDRAAVAVAFDGGRQEKENNNCHKGMYKNDHTEGTKGRFFRIFREEEQCFEPQEGRRLQYSRLVARLFAVWMGIREHKPSWQLRLY